MKILVQSFRLIGQTPLIMHCGQTADPLSPHTKHIARASDVAKKNKTDENYENLAMAEWWAGLYVNKPLKIEGMVVTPLPGTELVIPTHVLDSLVRSGARVCKNGKQAAAGCLIERPGKFLHNGPKDLTALSRDPEFRFSTLVKVGQARVLRTRPVFRSWSVEFEVTYDAEVIKGETVLQSLVDAGRLVGLGDWRPGAPKGGSWGRFDAEIIK